MILFLTLRMRCGLLEDAQRRGAGEELRPSIHLGHFVMMKMILFFFFLLQDICPLWSIVSLLQASV